MTDREAIEYAENELESTSYTLETNNKLRGGLFKILSTKFEFLVTAKSALQEREKRSKNEPLTLEELRQMEGKPVFLLTGEVSIMEHLIGEWDILNYWEGDWFDFTRRKRMLSEKDYGLTWLTYRRPLKGADNGKAD